MSRPASHGLPMSYNALHWQKIRMCVWGTGFMLSSLETYNSRNLESIGPQVFPDCSHSHDNLVKCGRVKFLYTGQFASEQLGTFEDILFHAAMLQSVK